MSPKRTSSRARLRVGAAAAPAHVLLLSLSLVACKNHKDPSRTPIDDEAAGAARADSANLRAMTVDGTRCDSSGKRVQQKDLNHDNRADMLTLIDGSAGADRITCKQADLNFDGKLDAFFHYADDGALIREQFDLDFDGRIDMGRHYEKGDLVLDEQDLNQDGATDTWRRYDKGRLLRMEADRDADGRPDMFTFYVGATIDRIGYDVDGDGKVDRWDHDAARRARRAIEARARPLEEADHGSTADEEFVEEHAEDPTEDGEGSNEPEKLAAPKNAAPAAKKAPLQPSKPTSGR
ncbi:MAG: hypothetical protein V3V08_02125 [Nannocystaceae bacterium]